MSVKSRAAAKVAAKTGGKAVPGVGQLMMLLEGAPVAFEEGSKAFEIYMKGHRKAKKLAKQGKYVEANKVLMAAQLKAQAAAGKGAGKTFVSAVVAREAAERMMPSRKNPEPDVFRLVKTHGPQALVGREIANYRGTAYLVVSVEGDTFVLEDWEGKTKTKPIKAFYSFTVLPGYGAEGNPRRNPRWGGRDRDVPKEEVLVRLGLPLAPAHIQRQFNPAWQLDWADQYNNVYVLPNGLFVRWDEDAGLPGRPLGERFVVFDVHNLRGIDFIDPYKSGFTLRIKQAGKKMRSNPRSKHSVDQRRQALNNPMMNEGPLYQDILAHLRALQWRAWAAHWQAKGPSYYGDHKLLQRLYEGKGGGPDINEEIDALGERMVAFFGAPSVDPRVINGRVQQLLSPTDEPFEDLLKLEMQLQTAIRRAWKANQKSGEHMSLGLDDLLMGLANEREGAIYLIRRRLGGRKPMSGHESRPPRIPPELRTIAPRVPLDESMTPKPLPQLPARKPIKPSRLVANPSAKQLRAQFREQYGPDWWQDARVKAMYDAARGKSQARLPRAKRARSAPGVRRFEFVGGSSAKFWEVSRRGKTMTAHWGRLGTKGQTKSWTFGSTAAAREAVAAKIREKLNKGYLPVF